MSPVRLPSQDASLVRKVAREGLRFPVEERQEYWRRRRLGVIRRLYDAGMNEDDLIAELRQFSAAVKREVKFREIALRVEKRVHDLKKQEITDEGSIPIGNGRDAPARSSQADG